MKIARVFHNKKAKWAILEGSHLRLLKGDPYHGIKSTSQKIPVLKAKFLPPAAPSKIILVGLNYKDHAKELKMEIPKEPIVFLKPSTSLIGHRGSILYPKGALDMTPPLIAFFTMPCF